MFNNSKFFSSFSCSDLSAIKDFYINKLGFEIEDEFDGGMSIKNSKGNSFMVYEKGEGHQPATYTCLNIIVDDVEKCVDELNAAGITMEQYESMNTNEKGISEEGMGKMAWFTDPSGNIISIMTQM